MNGLDRKAAQVTKPDGDGVANIGTVLADPAAERKHVDPLEHRHHPRDRLREVVREMGESERVVEAAECL